MVLINALRLPALVFCGSRSPVACSASVVSYLLLCFFLAKHVTGDQLDW